MKEYLSDNLGFFSRIRLSDDQEERLHDLFDDTFELRNTADQETLYANFNAFAVEVFRLFNDASGLAFTTLSPLGQSRAVFAVGVGADAFKGYNTNTDIPHRHPPHGKVGAKNTTEMEHPENDAQYTGLTVNSGVAQPPIVNPYLTRRRRKPMPTAAEMVDGIVKGDVTMLSRAVTLVESLQPEHYALAREVIDKCLPYSGNSAA